MRALLVLLVALAACSKARPLVEPLPLVGMSAGSADVGSTVKPVKVVSLSGTATATGGAK